ncbi:MAG: hypothetical protein Ta2A_03720 [Treponemataceae bacterium]|nr:MAG: hypothetical protein Ta2A_03720 [Treponemataceae bacterium]
MGKLKLYLRRVHAALVGCGFAAGSAWLHAALRSRAVFRMQAVCAALAFFAVPLVFAQTGAPVGGAAGQSYRIAEVEYDITGRTTDYAISLAIPIDKERVFESREYFDEYIEFLGQEFHNLRQLEEASIDVSFGAADENRIIQVSLKITGKDTFNFIVVPYPKYDSNTGFEMKLRGKDYNFLGTLETFNFELLYKMQGEDTSDSYNHVVGLGADYTYPFALAMFDAKWSNDLALSYTFGKNRPGINYTTGLNLTKPFKRFSVNFGIGQSVSYGYDYNYDKNYPDDSLLLFGETVTAGMSVRVATIAKFVDINFNPYISFGYNWTTGYRANPNTDTPILGAGYAFSGGQINEVGTNFRKGVFASIGQSVGYRTRDRYFEPKIVDFNFLAFAAAEYESISTRINYFKFIHNGTGGLGGNLRGVRDSQLGVDTVTGAVVVNIDIPIKIFQTDWLAYKFPKFFRYLNFELQAAPFIDMAFAENPHTGRNYAFKDGWIAGGLEVLVYPSKWRSLTVRASAGIDLTSFVGSRLFDMSWRESKSKYEIFIGIGKLY